MANECYTRIKLYLFTKLELFLVSTPQALKFSFSFEEKWDLGVSRFYYNN